LIQAAKALETTKSERTDHGLDAMGKKRGAIGVLMSVLGWDGGTYALSESPGEANKIRKQSSEIDSADKMLHRRKLCDMLSERIVGRIGYMDGTERKSYKEIAEWLRLLASD
jgi:hypothetical protein